MKIPRINLLTISIMCFTAAAVLLVLLLSGCATTSSGKVADAGLHGDHATTAVGLGFMGATELNPLAPLAPLRYWAVKEAETQRCDDRTSILRAASASGWGATGWNVFMLALGPGPAIAGGIVGMVGGYNAVDCEAAPATPQQLAVLARWERIYEAGDAAAVQGLVADAELADQYADLFSRTTTREADYRRVEAVRDGFIAEYAVRLVYDDGTDRAMTGDLRFQMADDGRIEEVSKL